MATVINNVTLRYFITQVNLQKCSLILALSTVVITAKCYVHMLLQSAAYLYDAFKILTDSVTMANRMNPNFTQIQQPCGSVKGWQFSNMFQPILNKVKQ